MPPSFCSHTCKQNICFSRLPSCFTLGSSTQCFTWPSLSRLCLQMLVYNSSSPTNKHLHFLFPPLFLVFFSLLVFHRPSCRFLSTPGAALLFSHIESCYTEIRWETHTKIQTTKWNQAELPSWVHVPHPRQAVHGHTAAMRLTDSWHRMAARRTQNLSQGADACFLLTYAPEMEQGG